MQRDMGRDEPILDPDLPIIDSHFHLIDRPGLRYLLDDYVADVAAGHRIMASVYVETLAHAYEDGPELLRPLGEIKYADGLARQAAEENSGTACQLAAAIVGYADLRHGDAVGALLDGAIELSPGKFRGIRQIANDHPTEAPYRFMPKAPPRALLDHPRFRSGFAQLAPRGLSFDAALFHHQLPGLAALADAFPDTSIVLNHCGQAIDMDGDDREEVFQAWRHAIHDLARRPNVTCKIGGFGLPFWGFGFELRTDAVGFQELADAWRPYVETTIEAFGAARCMMESDYPPDSRSCGFVPLWNALKHIVRDASPDEKMALFHDTAARVYRIA